MGRHYHRCTPRRVVLLVHAKHRYGHRDAFKLAWLLYLYTKDAPDVSNCSGQCAVNWPPYTRALNEPLVGGEGVDGLIATIPRADGTEQLTYNGVPLYFWKDDVKPGDTRGQNVGGVWFVVKP